NQDHDQPAPLQQTAATSQQLHRFNRMFQDVVQQDRLIQVFSREVSCQAGVLISQRSGDLQCVRAGVRAGCLHTGAPQMVNQVAGSGTEVVQANALRRAELLLEEIDDQIDDVQAG